MKYLKKINEAASSKKAGKPTPTSELLKLYQILVDINKYHDYGIPSNMPEWLLDNFIETKMDLELFADAPSNHEAFYFFEKEGIYMYILNQKIYKIYNPEKTQLPFKIGDNAHYEFKNPKNDLIKSELRLLGNVTINDKKYNCCGIMGWAAAEFDTEASKAYEILVKGTPFTQF